MSRLERFIKVTEPYILGLKVIGLFFIGLISVWWAFVVLGNAGIMWASVFLLGVVALTISSTIDVLFRIYRLIRRRDV